MIDKKSPLQHQTFPNINYFVAVIGNWKKLYIVVEYLRS